MLEAAAGSISTRDHDVMLRVEIISLLLGEPTAAHRSPAPGQPELRIHCSLELETPQNIVRLVLHLNFSPHSLFNLR